MEQIRSLTNKKQDLENKLKFILNKDLEILAEEERNIERWFELLGNVDELSETKKVLNYIKKQLLSVDKKIIEALALHKPYCSS